MASHLGSWEFDMTTRGFSIFVFGGFAAAVIVL
jgi:hypothetical protein